jgi:hypothetical protein
VLDPHLVQLHEDGGGEAAVDLERVERVERQGGEIEGGLRRKAERRPAVDLLPLRHRDHGVRLRRCDGVHAPLGRDAELSRDVAAAEQQGRRLVDVPL